MRGEPRSAAVAAWMEGLPAGPKLIALALLASALLFVQSPWLLGSIVTFGVALGFLALGQARLVSGWSPGLGLAIAALVLFTLAVEGPLPSLVVLLRLLALVVFAQLVTETTRASAIQDALVTGLRPFERLPFVSADKAGLALAITLRSLPRVRSAARELREAREARGLAVSAHLLVIPLVARILQDARETAEAIDARSWSGTKRAGPPSRSERLS